MVRHEQTGRMHFCHEICLQEVKRDDKAIKRTILLIPFFPTLFCLCFVAFCRCCVMDVSIQSLSWRMETTRQATSQSRTPTINHTHTHAHTKHKAPIYRGSIVIEQATWSNSIFYFPVHQKERSLATLSTAPKRLKNSGRKCKKGNSKGGTNCSQPNN